MNSHEKAKNIATTPDETRGQAGLSAKEPVGLIGTGLFGTALADRLLSEQFSVVVYNRTRSKAEPLLIRGATWSDNPLAECRRVIFAVYTTGQVEELWDRMASNARTGQIILDTSTSDPQQTIAFGRRLASHGINYLEAPFSGSSEQTRNHESTALVAGEMDAFEACRDLWECLAAKTFYLGAWGNAAKMKLVTNLVLGLNRAVLAEGLAFANAVGLKMDEAMQVLLHSPAYSKIMEAKGPKMIRADFAPQARLAQHTKDVRLILAEAARGSISLPLSSAHLELLQRAESAGLGELDNSAIIRVFQQSTG
jgi:3-hydroxyisobutyrate dehydrogenase-like beta-hydroxyacid dehydrogenase